MGSPAQHPITRNDLGDLDEARWPDGKDPWAFTMIIAFKDAKGALFKFSTSTTGGSNAMRKMLRHVAERSGQISRPRAGRGDRLRLL